MEARRYANDKEDCPGKIDNKGQLNAEKQSRRKKKSWRTVLFSFWKKTEKKSNQCPKEASSSLGSHFASLKPRGHVSGPIHRNGGVRAGNRLPSSGPLMSLFHPRKREEDAMPTPYVSLGKANKMQYGGPLYLVS